jgi:hypothetical protein
MHHSLFQPCRDGNLPIPTVVGPLDALMVSRSSYMTWFGKGFLCITAAIGRLGKAYKIRPPGKHSRT